MRLASGALFRAWDADRVLRRARRRGARRFATAWIRGLGDVASILSPFVAHVRRAVPGAEVTALVRPGLEEACRWIEGLARVVPVAEWRREQTVESVWGLAYPPPWEIRRALVARGLAPTIDALLPYPLGRWYAREFAEPRPALRWTPAERQFGEHFLARAFPETPRFVVTVNSHVGTGRYYDFPKEWGTANFAALIRALLASAPEARVVLVDAQAVDGLPADPRILDARGKLSVAESLSVIAASDCFVGLDAGPATLVYFVGDVTLEIVAILGRTSCFAPLQWPSPSRGVRLTALVGEREDVRTVTPARVLAAVLAARDRRRRVPS